MRKDKQISQCHGKEAMDRKTANMVAKAMRRRKNKNKNPATAYECRFCGSWHVGGKA